MLIGDGTSHIPSPFASELLFLPLYKFPPLSSTSFPAPKPLVILLSPLSGIQVQMASTASASAWHLLRADSTHSLSAYCYQKAAGSTALS